MLNFRHTIAMMGLLQVMFIFSSTTDAAVIAGDRLLVDLGQPAYQPALFTLGWVT